MYSQFSYFKNTVKGRRGSVFSLKAESDEAYYFTRAETPYATAPGSEVYMLGELSPPTWVVKRVTNTRITKSKFFQLFTESVIFARHYNCLTALFLEHANGTYLLINQETISDGERLNLSCYTGYRMVLPFLSGRQLSLVPLNNAEKVKSLVTGLCEKLDYLHSVLGISHGDLHESNILVGEQFHVRLCDFGISAKIGSPARLFFHSKPQYANNPWYEYPTHPPRIFF